MWSCFGYILAKTSDLVSVKSVDVEPVNCLLLPAHCVKHSEGDLLYHSSSLLVSIFIIP